MRVFVVVLVMVALSFMVALAQEDDVCKEYKEFHEEGRSLYSLTSCFHQMEW